MTKKTKKKSSKSEDDKLKKILEEREFVKREIESVFKAEAISVDVEHREVFFFADYKDYDVSQKDFKTDRINFKYESCDSVMMSLKFSYTINK